MRRERTRFCKSPDELPKELRVNDVFPLIRLILDSLEIIMSELSDLQDQVAATIGIEQSAVTLIKGLGDKIDALIAGAGGGGVDPAELVKLKDSLHAEADALAAAVTAGSDKLNPPPVVTPAPADGAAPAAGDAAPSA